MSEASDLGEAERQQLLRAARLFDTGYFFECHDVLEEVWAGVRGDSRDFLQGLIQVAVGFYHLGNGNRVGAVSLFSRALGRLRRYPERYLGLDLARLRAEVASWRERVESGGPAPTGLDELPKWRLGDGPR